MTAYYNEIDPYAAQWLRNLISAGHIAPGDVDERSIEDVRPDDIRGYTQCHFFAGIGVWSRALRNIGFPDSARIWTGSCPCQPFSQAGKGAGVADERHLWPAFHHLILACEPERIVGEQVASKDGLAWLDIVQADMEAAGHTFGAVDFCAAGVGAPHIRQRLYWVADAAHDGRPEWPRHIGSSLPGVEQFTGRGGIRTVEHSEHEGLERYRGGSSAPVGWNPTFRPTAETGEFSGLADSDDFQQRDGRDTGSAPSEGLRPGSGIGRDGERVADAPAIGRHEGAGFDATGSRLSQFGFGHSGELDRPGPTNGRWEDVDWLFCRDAKWRPVEPGTFPLAHGAPARVGRLRAYGNAINLAQAEVFLAAALT